MGRFKWFAASLVLASSLFGAPAVYAQDELDATALDPLTEEEKQLAERLVRADARAAQLLGKSAELVSVEFLAIKGPIVRHADLLFSVNGGEFGARGIVQLGAKPNVSDVERVDARSLPVTRSEVQQAWRIAQSDPAIADLLRAQTEQLTPEALRMFSNDRNDPCFSGRCLYLIVRAGEFYVSDASVVVDLATRRILGERREP